MKSAKFLRLCAQALLTSAALNATFAEDSQPPQTVKATDGRELKLVWNDEFNGEGLPDSTKWNCSVGVHYGGNWYCHTGARQENVFQKDGVLTIRTIKEEFPVKDLPHNQDQEKVNFTSACLTTRGLASWTHGRIEIRAKLPKGRGIASSIMTLVESDDILTRRDAHQSGNFDIISHDGAAPRNFYSTVYVHAPGANPEIEPRRSIGLGRRLTIEEPQEAPTDRFYVYTFEWTQEKFTVLLDDKVWSEYTAQHLKEFTDEYPFVAPHYLIISGELNGYLSRKTLPAELIIDYVRVYQ